MVWSNITQSEWDVPDYYDNISNWKLSQEDAIIVTTFSVFFSNREANHPKKAHTVSEIMGNPKGQKVFRVVF